MWAGPLVIMPAVRKTREGLEPGVRQRGKSWSNMAPVGEEELASVTRKKPKKGEKTLR